jgi:hypothetical protein
MCLDASRDLIAIACLEYLFVREEKLPIAQAPLSTSQPSSRTPEIWLYDSNTFPVPILLKVCETTAVI